CGRFWCRCELFFFQAEDGIRDWSVTGVQTCALPIYSQSAEPIPAGSWKSKPGCDPAVIRRLSSSRMPYCPAASMARTIVGATGRSEERRVGKEGRDRGVREPDKRT